MDSTLIDRPLLPGTGTEDAGRETWTMIFVLDTELDSESRRAVLDRIDLKAAFVRQVGERLALSVGVTGAMDDAMAFATGAALEALEAATETGVGIVEARMVGHSDVARQVLEHTAITFYGVTECAKSLGVTRQRVRQLMQEEKLPRPDAVVNGKPVWEATSFDQFASRRTELVSRTPIGHDPRRLDDNVAEEE